MRRLDPNRYEDAAFQRVRDEHTARAFIVGLRAVVGQELARAGKPVAR